MKRCLNQPQDYWHLDYDSVFNPNLFKEELETVKNLPIDTDRDSLESQTHNTSEKFEDDSKHEKADEEKNLVSNGAKLTTKNLIIEDNKNDTEISNIFKSASDYIQLIKCDFCDEMSKDEKVC